MAHFSNTKHTLCIQRRSGISLNRNKIRFFYEQTGLKDKARHIDKGVLKLEKLN